MIFFKFVRARFFFYQRKDLNFKYALGIYYIIKIRKFIILFELDMNVNFPLLRLLQFLSDLKSTTGESKKKCMMLSRGKVFEKFLNVF